MKYKCPKCGSTDIHGWREDIVETRYKITKDGKFYLKPYKTFYSGAGGNQGLICNKCSEIVNANWVQNDIKEWILKD